jgi:hypothetical protein
MRRRFLVVLLTTLVLLPNLIVSASAAEARFDTAIAWVADASGSVRSADPGRYWEEAVLLGVRLAPAHTEIAYFAVNDAVTARTELLDPSVPAESDLLVSAVKNTVCDGYTNPAVGLAEALQSLEGSSAKSKHIYLVADISESGFYLRSAGDYDRALENLADAANRAEESGAVVHLLFVGKAPANTEYLSAWEDSATRTGGSLTFVSAPSDLPKAVENLYFSHFSYIKTMSAGINTTGLAQEFPVEIPEFPMRRARIYVSAPNLAAGLQVRVAGAEFDLNRARTHAVVELSPPFSERVDLTLPSDAGGDVRIYLIADIDTEVAASPESVADAYDSEDGAGYRQTSTITVKATADGEPIVSDANAEAIDWRLSVIAPSGQNAQAETLTMRNGQFGFTFCPEEFGEYRVSLTLASKGTELAGDTSVEIAEIELPEKDYSLWIASGIGALVILGACLFAVYKRRERRTRTHIVSSALNSEEETEAKFCGRLDFYGIVVEGGKAEIPATALQLAQTEDKKSVTLAWAMERAGIPYHYEEALRIHLYPGRDGTLILRNRSDAVIYRAGQAYLRGRQTKIASGQKFAVVFEEGESEYEIYYRNDGASFVASGAG